VLAALQNATHRPTDAALEKEGCCQRAPKNTKSFSPRAPTLNHLHHFLSLSLSSLRSAVQRFAMRVFPRAGCLLSGAPPPPLTTSKWDDNWAEVAARGWVGGGWVPSRHAMRN